MKILSFTFTMVCFLNLLSFNGFSQSINNYNGFANLLWTQIDYPGGGTEDIYGDGAFENINFPENNSFDLVYHFDTFGQLGGAFANNINGVLDCDFTDDFLNLGYPIQDIPAIRVACEHNQSSQLTFDFDAPVDDFDLIIFDIDNSDEVFIEAVYQGNTITDFSGLNFDQGDIKNPDDAYIANWNPGYGILTSSNDLENSRNFFVLHFEDFPVDEVKITFHGGTPPNYMPHFYMSLFSSAMNTTIPSLCEGDNPFSGNTYKQWHTGGGGGLVFNADGVQTFEELGINSEFPNTPIESSSTYCDPITGEVLIYSDGMTAWRGNGNVIPSENGGSVYNNISGLTHGAAGSPLIVAPPGQCVNPDELYIFFTDDESLTLLDTTNQVGTYRNPELYYVIVDLINNVVTEPVQFTDYPTSEQINAVQVNCDSIWIIYRADGSNPGSKGNSLYAHLWTSAGISNNPITTNDIYIADDYRYRSAFSLDGKRFAATCAGYAPHNNSNEKILLCDFDQTTGQFSNPIYLYDENPSIGFINYGIAFSPDHSKLYSTNEGKIIQYNLSSNDPTQIQNSRINISDVYWHGGLQNGPDGKIYAARGGGAGGNSSTLSIIHAPNLEGSNCGYELNALSTGERTTSGLQNLVYGKGPAACLPHISEVASSCNIQISLNDCYPGGGAPYAIRILNGNNLVEELINLMPNASNELTIVPTVTGAYDFQLVDAIGNPGPIYYNVNVAPSSPIFTTIYETIDEDDCYYFLGECQNVEGVYEETLTSFYGCDSIVQLTLTVNAINTSNELQVEAIIHDASCHSNDGSIVANVTGGQPPYGYQWSTGASSLSIYDLSPDAYSLTVTDTQGEIVTVENILVEGVDIENLQIDTIEAIICQGEIYSIGTDQYFQQGVYCDTTMDNSFCPISYCLYLEVSPFNSGMSSTDANCGESNGTATSNPSSEGANWYQYQWSTGAITPTIENLAAGMYYLTISDDVGCSKIDSVQISNIGEAPIEIDTTICFGTCLEIADQSFCNSGEYAVTNSDTCGGNFALSLTIAEDLEVELDATGTNFFCMDENDGIISTMVTGGIAPYTYDWTNSLGELISESDVLETVSGGIYNIMVADAVGCVANSSIELVSINLDTFYVTTSICEGSFYELNGEMIDQEGTYTANNIPSENGCDSTVILTLSIEGIGFSDTVTNASCGESDGAIDININNQSNYSFNWNTGENVANISNLSVGIYSLTITDSANGCTSSSDFEINYLPIDTTYLSVQFCPDSCYVVGDSLLCSPGIHSIQLETIVDACDSLVIVNLSLEPALMLELTTISENCEAEDGAILSNVSGGIPPYNFNWMNSDGVEIGSDSTLQNVGAGTYVLEVTDSLGCVISIEATVESIDINLVQIDTTLCPGGTIELNGNYYRFPGTYTETMTNIFGCDSTVKIVLDTMEFGFDILSTNPSCGSSDGEAAVSIANPSDFWYNWSTGDNSPVIQQLPPDIYHVTVTNVDNGCSLTDSVTIDYLPKDSVFVEICEGDCFEVGDNLYCDPGSYRDTLQSVVEGCDSIVVLQINQLFIPIFVQEITQISVCVPEIYDLTGYVPAGGEFTGFWSSPDPDIQFVDSIANPAIAYNLKQGENIFIWNISRGECFFADTTIVFYEGLPIAVDDYFEVSFNADTTLNLTANDDLFEISNESILFTDSDSVTVLNDSLVNFKAPNGFFGMLDFQYLICNTACPEFCDTATVEVKVLPYETDSPFPDIITPNGDGLNDQWVVDPLLISPQDYPDNELQIFNRWGDQVYYAKPYNNDWEGASQRNGTPLPESTYYYILYLNVGAGEVYHGKILINR